MHEKKKNTANRLHTLTLALSLYVHFCTSVSAADFSRIQKQMVNIFGEIKVGWDKETDKKVTIIAGNDEKFEEGTKHAEGLVIDLRGRHLEYNRENPHDQKAHEIHDVAQAIQNELGETYDVVVEIFQDNPARNHIHIEYDPSGADDPNWYEVAVDVY